MKSLLYIILGGFLSTSIAKTPQAPIDVTPLRQQMALYNSATISNNSISGAEINIQSPRIKRQSQRADLALQIVSTVISFASPYSNWMDNNRQRAQEKDNSVTIRIWMHNGEDSKQHGCGFYAKLEGYLGGEKSTFFPDEKMRDCPTGKFVFRMTPISSTHGTTLHLRNDQQHIHQVELHSDGWENTFVTTACFRFNANTGGGGGLRSVCINKYLLHGCKTLFPETFSEFYFTAPAIQFTKSNRRPGGLHRIIVSDVEQVIKGFEQVVKKIDEMDGMYKICDRILVTRLNETDRFKCFAYKSCDGCTDIVAEVHPYGCI